VKPVALYRGADASGVPLALLGFGMQPARLPVTERTLSTYAAVFVDQGTGTLQSLRAGRCVVEAPALFWLFPGEVHSYGPDAGTVWHERWILFDGPLVRALEKVGLMRSAAPVVGLIDATAIVRLFAALHSDSLDASPLAAHSAGAGVHRLIVEAARQSQQAALPGPAVAIEAIAEALRARAFSPLDLDAFAREFGMAPATLRRRFSAAYGMPPKAYQLRLRLDRAKELLALTDDPVEAVAETVGFTDSFYFSRLFHASEGLSPSDYRSRTRRS
jgi:AraC-like DNA-binding protein